LGHRQTNESATRQAGERELKTLPRGRQTRGMHKTLLRTDASRVVGTGVQQEDGAVLSWQTTKQNKAI
jgi:hypothetical protein